MFRDLSYGLQKEKEVYEVLVKYYPNLEATPIYCYWDYENDDYIIELKSRRCKKAHYPDTMIPLKKVKAMLRNKKKSISVFNFTDGLYYYPLTEESIKCCRQSKGGRLDRGSYEIEYYLYIPIDKLIEVEPIVSSCESP